MALSWTEHKLEGFSVEKTPKYSELCDRLLNSPFCYLPPPGMLWGLISRHGHFSKNQEFSESVLLQLVL